MQTVTFNNKTYLVSPGAGAPAEAIDPHALNNAEQVEVFNLLTERLSDGKRVKRFSDRKAGAKRVIDKLVKWGEHDPSTPEPARAKKKSTAPAKERKKRGMRFVFPYHGQEHMRTVRSAETLRGQCVELLREGATFDQVRALVERFDKSKGRPSEHVERRAYELVRIMHYYLGWGIAHDNKTGSIKLHQRAVG